jgi:hypothetical protein
MLKTPDNFSWDFEITVTEMKDDLYLSKKGEVFAFDFIQKYEEMFAREDALAKKREAKEKEENERYARERREKQKNMSEEESKTKEAMFPTHQMIVIKHRLFRFTLLFAHILLFLPAFSGVPFVLFFFLRLSFLR